LETEKKALIEIISVFEIKANELINLLATNFDLNLNSNSPFDKFLNIKNNLKKGKLNDDWMYWFHGSHCDFENIKTKQYLHVSIISEKNYGAIDYFYLYKFFVTTQLFDNYKNIITSENVFFELLDTLKTEGNLVENGDSPFSIWILNQNLKI